MKASRRFRDDVESSRSRRRWSAPLPTRSGCLSPYLGGTARTTNSVVFNYKLTLSISHAFQLYAHFAGTSWICIFEGIGDPLGDYHPEIHARNQS